ncbi:MAG TPA: ABC transporter permease [Candidatus Sulfotelmatobacter sp.]|nr:ABC transporter permease [Candidatus Sulfotelmatobacter sp.]
MSTMLQDASYGLRMLRKNPSFTAIAVIALALGIASTTAIFSVVDSVLLHPLPYPKANEIVYVSQTNRDTGAMTDAFSPANYLDLAAQTRVFSVMAAARGWQGNLSGGDRPERIRMTVTTASFFSLFGVPPMLGRGLLPSDESAGSSHVVVLSYGLWTRRYAADRTLVGRNIEVDNQPYEVVGVMPPTFSPDEYGELWLPSPWGVPSHPLMPNADPRQMRDRNYLDVWARLKPGVTLQQARADINAIAGRLEKQYPDSNDRTGIGFLPMQEYMVGDVRPMLWVLLAAVSFVLLIGCANVANLLLARATARTREISIRSAMGAGRFRLVRQFVTESILLGLMGGLLGILLAAWAIPALLALSPSEIRNFGQVGINKEVLGFSLVLSVLTGILFGLVPALQSSATNLNESLKEGERGSTGSHGHARSVLIVAEVGLSLVLLIGTGLMVKSFSRLLEVNPGFDAKHLLVFTVGLPSTSSPEQQDAFYHQVVERLQTLPGVQAVGAVSRLPLAGGNSSRSFTIPGSARKDYSADIRISTPNYFRAMGIPLLEGRSFTESDASGSSHAAIVNEAFVQNFFPGQDVVGKSVADFGPTSDKLQIVGVVGSVRHTGLESAPRPEIYLPFGQAHWPSAVMAVRTTLSDPTALTVAAQNAVWSVDKNVPLASVRTMDEVIAASVLQRKFTMLLLVIFAGMAVLLAAIGLYGVMSYSVSQRNHEIGIRMALGAQRGDVLRLMVGRGMGLAGAGLLLGIVASLGLTRLINRLLFGISATDPWTFIIVSLGLAGVALLANYLPARRAAEVDPMVALRYE